MYPYRSKKVITRERKMIMHGDIKSDDANDIVPEASNENDENDGEEENGESKGDAEDKVDKDRDLAKEKVDAVTPIRITSGTSKSEVKLAKRVDQARESSADSKDKL